MTNAGPPLLSDLRLLLMMRGREQYSGEPVTHLQHACMTAQWAQQAKAPDSLVVASLLHDVGHLISGLLGTPSAQGLNDQHEDLGAEFLGQWFGPEVTEPVRLHVQAKRYLAAHPGYRERLSADSTRSLALQGGVMDAAERAAFEALPGFHAAVQLRTWDDAAKLLLPTPGLDAFWPLVLAAQKA
ncbi:MAG: HD domain-containing protein [Burkholderiaceae bacterium]